MKEQKKILINRLSLKKGVTYKHPSIAGDLKFKAEEKNIDRFFRFKNNFIDEIVLPESELKYLKEEE